MMIKEYKNLKSQKKNIIIDENIKGIVGYTFQPFITNESFDITENKYMKFRRNGM